MSEEKKALFLDMDGTTLNDQKQISEETLEALEAAVKAGHEVVIATGRAPEGIGKMLEQYGLDRIGCHYVIGFNGANMVDVRSGEVLYRRPLPSDTLCRLIDLSRERQIYLQIYEGGRIYTEKPDENLEGYRKRIRLTVEIVPDLKAVPSGEVCKALAVNMQSANELVKFQNLLMEEMGDQIDSFFSNPAFLEIVPKGISKGTALEAFCARLGIPASNSVAVGDENNDLSMIRAAGIGCAVANASAEVRAAADYVTKRDNNHSAVAEVVRRFLL